jgi:hypothetical protein
MLAGARHMAQFRQDEPRQRVEIPIGEQAAQAKPVLDLVDRQHAVHQPGTVLAPDGAGVVLSLIGKSPAIVSRMSVTVAMPSMLPYSSTTIAI